MGFLAAKPGHRVVRLILLAVAASVLPPGGLAAPLPAQAAHATVNIEISPNGSGAGTTYTVTATVSITGAPVSGATVTWTASPISAPSPSQPAVTPTSSLTDSDGKATTTVRSTNAGTSTITATATDATDSQSGSAQATWTPGEPAGGHVDPTTFETVNTPQILGAEFRDAYNNPVKDGTVVTLTASGTGGESPSFATATTSGGSATFDFTSTRIGTSRITATSGSALWVSGIIWTCPVEKFSGAGFMAYSASFGGGVFVASGDLDADGCNEVITGAGEGGGPHVRTFLPDGTLVSEFMAYGPIFAGGVRVAAGDVNGDGKADIVTGAGPGGAPHVKVFSGADYSLLHSFMAYDPTFTGGVFVAAGDLDGDHKADIITGADAGGGPHVQIFSGADLSSIHSFMAYDPSFPGGVRVGSADLNRDGRADILTAAGPGGGPHVRALSGADLSFLASFMAYAPSFTGGMFVAAGDVNGDGSSDIVTGPGASGGPHLKVFDSLGPILLGQFMTYNPSFMGGVRVAAGDSNGDGYAEIVTAPGPGGGPHVKVHRPGQLIVAFANGVSDADKTAAHAAANATYLRTMYGVNNDVVWVPAVTFALEIYGANPNVRSAGENVISIPG